MQDAAVDDHHDGDDHEHDACQTLVEHAEDEDRDHQQQRYQRRGRALLELGEREWLFGVALHDCAGGEQRDHPEDAAAYREQACEHTVDVQLAGVSRTQHEVHLRALPRDAAGGCSSGEFLPNTSRAVPARPRRTYH